jgi:hypothetical protein
VALPGNLLLQFLVLYLLTVAWELPVLVIGLSRRHSIRDCLFAAIWLNACSYPVVFFVFPELFPPQSEYVKYIVTAEVFAPLSECLLFWLAFIRSRPWSRGATIQDMAVVVLANLTSFGVGKLLEPCWKIG